jgi:hypothetical protein
MGIRAFLRLLTIGAILPMAWTPGPPLWAQAVTLEVRLQEGMDLRYEMIQTTQIDLDIPQAMLDRIPPEIAAQSSLQTLQKSRMVYRMQVLGEDEEGNLRIRTTYESVEFESTDSRGSERFDSRVDPAPTGVQSGILASMVGLEMEGLVRRDGTSIPGTFRASKTREEILEAAPPEARGVLGPMVSAMLSPDGMGDMIPGAREGWPSGAVEVGHGWSVDSGMRIPAAGDARYQMAFTLAAVESWEGRRVARIEGEMTAEVDLAGLRPALDELAPGDLLNVPPVPATSVMRFDLDEGILVESVLRTDLSREVMGMSTTGWSTVETRLIR